MDMTRAVATKELTEMQAEFVQAILAGNPIPVAAKLAGYAEERGGHQAISSPAVQAALQQGRENRLKHVLSAKAMATMDGLLDDKTPAATRFAAAKWVLESAGHGSKDADEGKDKPIHEMTEAELMRFMARAQAVVEEGRDAPIIVVTPDNGALPAPSSRRGG
jgi:hypothetical protein